MSETTSASVSRSRRSIASLGTFIFGLPLGIGILACLFQLPEDSEARRYIKHPVEQVEVILFCCALGALLGKVLGQASERLACRRELLPPWEGQAVPVSEASPLLADIRRLGRRLQNTYLGRRVAAVLEFVYSRGSANELDDQIRSLSDSDAIALEGSYSLIRLIIWAIPILGFLGTVLGITKAISGVTPEQLENSLSGVTDGLSEAFDTTALGLGLTMILMFVNSIVDRFELRTLEMVDRYVDEQLAHRFERTGPESGEFVGALRQNSQVLLKTTEQLVERQAAIWGKSMEKVDRALGEASQRQQERLSSALESALQHALVSHHQRLMELENQTLERSKALYEGLTALATVLRDTGREHQASLAQVTERLTAEAETLAAMQEGEAHLVRLQETLQQNLSALAGTGSFEQAVQSLTAAIHLLTARAAGAGGRLGVWPGNAA